MKSNRAVVLRLMGIVLICSGCEQDFGLSLEKRASTLVPAALPTQVAPAIAVAPPNLPMPAESSLPDIGAGRASPVPAVCDPLSAKAQAGLSAANGMRASLRYLSGAVPPDESCVYFRTHGVQVPADIFVGNLNVPTRSFATGFPSANGDYLRDLNGQILIEHFSLSFDSEVRLTDADAEGAYQFALISDDGSILTSLADPKAPEVLIDDDGGHASRLAVSPKAVTLAKGSSLPIHVEYFQGPRYNIALVMLWRKVADTTAASLHEPLDGSMGPFYNDDRSPTANYAALLGRGWKVLPAANLFLKGNVVNPCAGK